MSDCAGDQTYHLTVTLKITSILVHWDLHNSFQNGEDLVLGLCAFLKFKVVVPERMRKEIQADEVCATLKEPKEMC